jgi:ribonuclease HI
MSSGTEGDSKLWKSLWAIKAPGKMKITFWRFAHDCLPSGHQLQKRQIPACPNCIFCGRHESVEHSLLFCQFAREVWEVVRADHPINLQRKHFISTRVWTLDFLDRCSDMEATAMLVTLWHIWDARNKIREGEPMMHPRSVAEKALAYIQMIATYLYKPSVSHRRETNSSVPKWSPPPASTVLVNVDAAIFSASRRMGVGVVIRDHNGVCLTACSEYHEEVRTPEIAEALALRRAINLAKDEGFTKIIINSDCLSVVNRVISEEEDRSLCGPVIHDIRRMVASFSTCSIKHVSRLLNVAAHTLAKFSESLGCRAWRGVAPDCIREIICKDILIV